MKGIKKMSENELLMAKAVCDFHPFARESVLIDKGDMKAPDWSTLLDWEDSFPDWWNEDEDETIPMKDLTRQKRRKNTFRKHERRIDMYLNKGYTVGNLSVARQAKTKEGVGDAPKVLHQDKMYFRGDKAQKKLGKAMTTKEARNLMAQIEWEAEQDKLAEYKEAERLFALDELASKRDAFNRLSFSEDSLIESMANLIDTINEAQNQLDMLKPRLNGLIKTKEHLRAEIAKLEEVVNS